jgi:ATP-binding cassette, subfamily C, bacterial CydD
MPALDRRLLRASRTARRPLLAAVAYGLVAAALVLAQALLLAHVVARVFLEHDAAVGGDLAALAAVVAGRALVAYGFEASGRLGALRVMSELRARLVEHVLRLRPAGLEGRRTGDLATAAVQGVDALEAYYARYLPQLVLAAFVPLAVLATAVRVDPASAAIMAATVPLIPLFMVLVGRFAQRSAMARWRALSRLGGHFLDVTRGLETLRAHGRAEAQTAVLERVGEQYRRETMRTLRVAFLSALVLELLAMLGTALVAVTLGVRLTSGGVGFEAALVVLLLCPELYAPLRQLGAQFHASADGLAAASELFALTEQPAAVQTPPAPAPVPDVRRARIAFEAVSFAYPERPGLALDAVDLVLEPGECVALVGASGSGKSTLASLLLRLADPSGGAISVAGVDLRELDPADWRAQLAWLPQRPSLLSGTVADNLHLAAPQASDARVRAAALAAGATFVERLPQGFDTQVGAGGRPLSAGETRRLALARAFLRDAPLLILDEPTAALDPDSASLVRGAIARLAMGRTTLLIAHDEVLAAQAHRVVRLDCGRLARQLPVAA